MNKTFYVTTPIYYVNSYPHLGHLYTTLIADTIARYKRQRGFDVFFLTGTDEHGINIERAAESAGLPVQQHVDKIVEAFKTAFAPYQFTNNHWVRTTDEYHKRAVQELWRRAAANGFIYKDKYEGWYCANCNQFYNESELEVVKDNVPYCPTHERPLDRIAEESYFFKLSAFQDRLLELYETNPNFIRPDVRRNEVISFIKGGLNDLSVSRVSVKWGIPVPDDPAHTMYVWFDALSNYITAIGFGNDQFGGEAHFKKFWPAELQLVGKDILRFHTVYWPAFLLAAGLEPPQSVFAHGMWLSGGRKMSKTLGNVIDLAVLQKYFSTDEVRYFCLREMVFGQDGDFTYEALIDRTNADLASGLGNLSSRTLTMIRNFCQSEIPTKWSKADSEFINQAKEIRELVIQTTTKFDCEFDLYNFSRALEAAWGVIARIDKFLSDAKPWDLAKGYPGSPIFNLLGVPGVNAIPEAEMTSEPVLRDSLRLVLHTAAEVIRHLTVLLAPVLPKASQAIWEQLGESGKVLNVSPASLEWGQSSGKHIGEVRPVFPRKPKKDIMEDIKKDEEISKAAREQEVVAQSATETPVAEVPITQPMPAVSTTTVTEPAPGIAYIGIEDFLKVELRVGEIKTAERIPKADKLLRFTIDLGEAQPRQILAGIAQYYEPEALLGRKVIVVANLAPRKLRGLESQGMILAASIGEEGRPVLAGFLEEVPNGAKLK